MESFISFNFGKTIKTTIGIENAICDNKTLKKPKLKLLKILPSKVNKIKKLAPIITSGDTNKILFALKKALRQRLFFV